MSNQNESYKRQGGGGQRYGNPNRKSNANEQRNEQGRDMTTFYQDNQQATAHTPAYDNRTPKYESNDGNSARGNRGCHSYSGSRGPWGGQSGGRPRAFNMQSSDRDRGGNSYPKGNNEDTACTIVKAEPEDTNAEKLLDPSSAIRGSALSTTSGMFKCEPNFTDKKQSLKREPDYPDELDVREKRQDQNAEPEKSCVKEIVGDLFTAPDDVSLAHCVGSDLRMGSGVALRFRDEFKSVGRLLDQGVGPGGVAHIRNRKRFIFYLVTKQHSKDKPTNDTMRRSLLILHQKCKDLGVTKIAMPRIGCGQDGLSWNDVKQMLVEIFADGFEITVYQLDEGFVDKSERRSKSRVVTKGLLLKDVEQGTGLLYIGCADNSKSDEMKSIDTKHPFSSRLQSKSVQLGFVVSTEVSRKDAENDYVYGLTCKKSAKSDLSYGFLEQSIQKLKKINERHQYQYFALQVFKDVNDPFQMDKIDTLLRNSGIDAEFWICCRPSELSCESMEVQGGQLPSIQGQQPISPHPTNSVVPSKDRQVKEVEKKIRWQSLAAENELETSNATDNLGWEDPILPPFPVVDETPSLCGVPEDEQDWPNFETPEDHQAYANAERRRSREKKEANETRKQKEKQDRRSGGQRKSCVTECKGDLFDADKTVSLAHCVGADFRMGAGIAILFRQRFRSVAELLDQRVDQGGVAYIRHEERYVFYLVTKRQSTGKPTLDTMRRSLVALHEKCKELNVTELAMPRIGCGLDRLDWCKVKSMLEDIFCDGFAIKIYNLEKDYQETPKSRPKTTFKYAQMYLKDIQPRTALLYIGTVDSYVSDEMKSLDEKHRFLARMDKSQQKHGTVVRTLAACYPHEKIYGLICKRSKNGPISFVDFGDAIKQLKKMMKQDGYQYLAMQVFEEKPGDDIFGKIITIFRDSYVDGEFWACYPPQLAHLMPASSPMYNPPAGGRSSWVDMDNNQIYDTIRDMQRTMESTHRKVLSVCDNQKEFSGPNGWKASANKIMDQVNEIGKEMMERFNQQSSKVCENIEIVRKDVRSLQQKITVLENDKSNMEKRLEILERRPYYSDNNPATNGLMHQYGNLEGLPQLVANQGPQFHQNHNLIRGLQPAGYSSTLVPPLVTPGYNLFSTVPGCVYVPEHLPGDRQALLRAVRKSGAFFGFKTSEASGTIFVSTQADFSNAVQINSHQDLTSYCEQWTT